MKCSLCSGSCRKTERLYVLRGAALVRVLACPHCVSQAIAIHMGDQAEVQCVMCNDERASHCAKCAQKEQRTRRTEKRSAELTIKAAARKLRAIAKGYIDTRTTSHGIQMFHETNGRIRGLEQAADIIEKGAF